MRRTLAVEYAIDLVSAANVHGARRAAIARVKRHREAAKFWLLSASRAAGLVPRPPCTITLTRWGSKPIDGHENLRMCWKSSVDGIACKPTRIRPAGFLEIDDGDPRLTWRYVQHVVPKKALGPLRGTARVRIEIAWDDGTEEETTR